MPPLKPFSKAWGVLVLTLVTLGAAWMLRPDPSSADQHLRRLESLQRGPFRAPTTTAQWFRFQTVRWLLQGRPTLQQWSDALEAEQQALINLGIYERRWIKLPAKVQIDHAALARTAIGKTRYSIHINGHCPTLLRVTARPDEIFEYEQTLHSIDYRPQ